MNNCKIINKTIQIQNKKLKYTLPYVMNVKI